MERTYWIAYRIALNEHHLERLADFIDALYQPTTATYWYETNNFKIFSSNLKISQIATKIKLAINTDKDTAVLGCTHHKSMRVIGKCDDQDLFSLVDFAAKH